MDSLWKTFHICDFISLITELVWLFPIVVQSLSHDRLFAAPWTAACQASLSLTVSWSLLKLMSLSWCYPTISSSITPFSSCPQSFPASGTFPMSWLSQNDRVEGCTLFSWNNTKITTSCWTTTDRRMLECTKNIPQVPGTKETLQWDGRRGAITLKSNPIPPG